jgi:hypothetical protein
MRLTMELSVVLILCWIAGGCSVAPARTPNVNTDRQALEQTSKAIVDAFSAGDRLMVLHAAGRFPRLKLPVARWL